MKKNLVLLLLLLSTSIQAQWIQQTSGSVQTLNDVYFLNQDTGFAVGVYTMVKTVNGGQLWETVFTGFVVLNSVCFTNSLTGFAVGHNILTNKSLLLKSTDGGVNWVLYDFTTSSILNSIQFIDNNTGFIVGTSGSAFKTSNGGLTWDTLNTGTSTSLQSVFFTDASNGIVVGGLITSVSTILKTTNGGLNWTIISAPTNDFLRGVFFPSHYIGYIVSLDGDILKSTDGGLTWHQKPSVNGFGNLDLYFLNDNTGYVVGGNPNSEGIQKTTDGGLTWYSQTAPVSQDLKGVFFTNENTGFCVGEEGTILKTINGGETGFSEVNNQNNTIIIYPNPLIDYLTVDIKEPIFQDTKIRIYDITGKMVVSITQVSNENFINLSQFVKGIYLLKIETNSASIYTKIIIN